ncbi:MAG: hypothetical protein ACRCSU_08245 [Paracoccaceae bacterium]
MTARLLMILMLATPVALSACGPLIGAGAAVGADKIAEDRGDDLF